MTTLAQHDPDDNDRRVLVVVQFDPGCSVISGTRSSNCTTTRVLEGERLFLRVLLTSPDGMGTLAQATPTEYRDKPFPDGGRWRGSIPRRLAGRGIIGAVIAPDGRLESHRSPRKSRRRGIAAVWKLIDANAGCSRLQTVEALLSGTGATHPRQRGLFDELDDDAQVTD